MTVGSRTGAPGSVAKGAFAPIVIIGVFGTTLGITYPVLSLMLARQGVSSGMIGLNGAMTPLGMVLSAPLVPRVVRAVTPVTLMAAAAVAMSGILGALAVFDDLGLWFVLRFVLGTCAVVMFILSETWISEVATASHRGKLLTAYTSVLALGFSVGPAVLAVSGNDYLLAMIVAIAGAILVLIPLRAARRQVPTMNAAGSVPVRQLVSKLSALLVAVVAVSVFDSVTLQFLPGYGLGEGLSPSLAALSLTVLLIGQVAFQYPLGWLADRMGARRALVLSLSVGAAGALALPLAVGDRLLFWPLVALWGGIAFAGYPLVLTILGEGLQGSSLLLGNTAFAMVWGLGGIIGPPYSGLAIDWLGPNGMPWSLATLWILALGIILGVQLAGRRKRSAAASLDDEVRSFR